MSSLKPGATVETLIAGRVYTLPVSEVVQGSLHACGAPLLECDTCERLGCLECDDFDLRECAQDEDELFVLCPSCPMPCPCEACQSPSQGEPIITPLEQGATLQPSDEDETWWPVQDTDTTTAIYLYPSDLDEDQRAPRGCRSPRIHRPPRG